MTFCGSRAGAGPAHTSVLRPPRESKVELRRTLKTLTSGGGRVSRGGRVVDLGLFLVRAAARRQLDAVDECDGLPKRREGLGHELVALIAAAYGGSGGVTVDGCHAGPPLSSYQGRDRDVLGAS